MALNSTPRTWVAAETVTAAELNAEIRDAVTGIQAAWTAYTPTTTGITLGNGTVTGRWLRIGKTVDFQCVFTFGSTSAVTASPTFTLPATAQTTGWYAAESTAYNTTNYWPIAGVCDTTARVICRVWNGTAGLNFSAISSTIPFTWATGHILTVQGRYEAA